MNKQKTLQSAIKQAIQKTELFLSNVFDENDRDIACLYEGMRYSALAGGKRIRPFLVFEFCNLFQGRDDVAQCFAAAVEMIHTYSLIHDDLPCMDNDDYRRGKLTNHKMFGEAEAILAGDALLTMAFETLAKSPAPASCVVRAVRVLAEAAGGHGMVGGQIMDIKAEKSPVDLNTLVRLHNKKTGALISASVQLGCIAAEIPANDARYKAAVNYASNIGVSFQIIDDILDRYGDSALLGKQTGQDLKDGKTTFLTFMSRDEAYREAMHLTEEAKKTISIYPQSTVLQDLADMLLTREK